MQLYDVAVVGGGPVGSRLAYIMAGMGHQVVVLDRKDSLAEAVCCTGIISRACVDSFDVDQGLILRETSSARVFSPSGKLLILERPEPQACVVDRAAFNAAFARRAIDNGAEYLLHNPVNNIVFAADRVILETIPDNENKTRYYDARTVVVASGASSKLTENLGLGKISDLAVGVQAEVETAGVDEVEVYLGHDIASTFFAWLVPAAPGKALVGLLSRGKPWSYIKKLIASLQGQGKIISQEPELIYGSVPLKPLPQTYGDRLLVVGSAAGQVKPITGGGIYYGLLCADIAADSLHQALNNGDLSARNLAGYQKEWQRRLGHELKVSYWARRFYALLSDTQIDRIFDIIKNNGIADAVLQADDLSFDWHGKTVLKLLGHRALKRFINTLKIPFSLGNVE